jgi:hypothetical protein
MAMVAFPAGSRAQLYLNDKLVGTITVRGHAHAWHYGDFAPAESFGEFAPLFGRWSLLMHADGGDALLSEAASDELRQTEIALDRVRARIFVPATQQWVEAVEINIDGPLIEWREG